MFVISESLKKNLLNKYALQLFFKLTEQSHFIANLYLFIPKTNSIFYWIVLMWVWGWFFFCLYSNWYAVMEFSWITDIFSKMEMKFASISFLILRASVWCSWNTATNQRVKQENRGLWEGPENLLSFQPWSMRGSGGMLGHCYPWIPHGGGFRILGKGGFLVLQSLYEVPPAYARPLLWKVSTLARKFCF